MSRMLIRELKNRQEIISDICQIEEDIRVSQVRTRAVRRAVSYITAKERVKTQDEFLSIEDLRNIMRRPLNEVKP